MSARHTFSLLFLLLWMTGCVTHQKQDIEIPQEHTEIWKILVPEVNDTQRITAKFSLQIATPARSGRLLGQLWGYPASLIRLDLTSSTGMAVAMIRESAILWTAYLPSENKAYYHPEAKEGLHLFHIPVPFTGRQIASLIQGNLGPILPVQPSDITKTPAQKTRVHFLSGPVEFLDMDKELNTLLIRGKEGWQIVCEHPYVLPEIPGRRLWKKYTFQSSRKGKVTLRIKHLDAAGSWTKANLALRPPKDIPWSELGPKPR